MRRDCNRQPPCAQISFELNDSEIKRMVWYDGFIEEHFYLFFLIAAVFAALAWALQNGWLLLVAGVIAAINVVMALVLWAPDMPGFVRNHQGPLQMLMYEELLVVRLRETDVKLEYPLMKRQCNMCGLWRLKCGDFFTLVLPNRIIQENEDFFAKLYTRIHAKKTGVPPIPPWEEIVNEMYGKPVGCDETVVDVQYSKDRCMRYVIAQSEKGWFTYWLEELVAFEEEEWQYISQTPNAYPATWEVRSEGSGISVFETVDELRNELQTRPAYKHYFEG